MSRNSGKQYDILLATWNTCFVCVQKTHDRYIYVLYILMASSFDKNSVI